MAITRKIAKWLIDKLECDTIPTEVLAINFGIQKVFDGYEIYQIGCDEYYNDHDTWLLSEIYQPADNFFNLGIESLNLSENNVYDIYKGEVLSQFSDKKRLPAQIKFITVTFFNGKPELIKTIN